MSSYRIYYVLTARPKDGKSYEAAKFWEEKGIHLFESMPGTKSVRAFACQYCLAGDFTIEIWQELENYGVFDKWDEMARANFESYNTQFTEFHSLYDRGPSRLVGDWPGCRLLSESKSK